MDPSYPLSPSEIVYLNADQFVKTARLGFLMLGSETKVNTNDLARSVLTAAFLAMEAAGELQIESEEYKRLIGKGRRIRLTPRTDHSAFPMPSLETMVQALVVRLSISEDVATVKDLVYAWLEHDDDNPWTKVLNAIPAYIADRGLLERIEEKKLKIFTVVNYELPEETRILIREAPIAEIQSLLATGEANRPDLCKQLQKEINQAISARDSSDDNIDFD
jgi:hypothetical protein